MSKAWRRCVCVCVGLSVRVCAVGELHRLLWLFAFQQDKRERVDTVRFGPGWREGVGLGEGRGVALPSECAGCGDGVEEGRNGGRVGGGRRSADEASVHTRVASMCTPSDDLHEWTPAEEC